MGIHSNSHPSPLLYFYLLLPPLDYFFFLLLFLLFWTMKHSNFKFQKKEKKFLPPPLFFLILCTPFLIFFCCIPPPFFSFLGLVYLFGPTRTRTPFFRIVQKKKKGLPIIFLPPPLPPLFFFNWQLLFGPNETYGEHLFQILGEKKGRGLEKSLPPPFFKLPPLVFFDLQFFYLDQMKHRDLKPMENTLNTFFKFGQKKGRAWKNTPGPPFFLSSLSPPLFSLTCSFFYLDQMKRRDLKPTENTLNAFFEFFAKKPNTSNQAKFEALVNSFELPTNTTRRRR